MTIFGYRRVSLFVGSAYVVFGVVAIIAGAVVWTRHGARRAAQRSRRDQP